jgi:putative CRISPR-associated protein (TIGR02619 family)
MHQQPQMLLCTVGTSLLTNLERLDLTKRPELQPLADAFRQRRWDDLARELGRLPAGERLCGAEINSIHCLLGQGHAPAGVGLTFFHSATEEGRAVARVLTSLYKERGHAPVDRVEVADLQDDEPRRFRTRGLRTLAREMCRVVRERSAPACAVNATGGYKAQIAVAVLLGQALNIHVYYLHEKFSEIIAFPPLPVSLDYEVWMRASGMLNDLARTTEPIRASDYEELDEQLECLVERVQIDGEDYLELAATGQIVRDTFRERFRTNRDEVLPPAALPGQKQKPHIPKDEGHLLAHRDVVLPFMQRVTDEVGPVVLCQSSYYNPDLPQRTRFVESREGIVGILSRDGWTMKFRVETTARTEGQRRAVLVLLNEWLDEQA